MNRRTLPLLAATLAALVLLGPLPATAWWWNDDEEELASDAEALALGWDDLVQPGFEPPPDPFMTMSAEDIDKLFDGSPESERKIAEYEAMTRIAPVNQTLDGKLVTLPGYVVPLDFDGQNELSEFLLVPYFGACIHTPPPPANQIVLAELEEPFELEEGYLPVQLRGIMRTEAAATPMAETGYRMDVIAVERYEGG